MGLQHIPGIELIGAAELAAPRSRRLKPRDRVLPDDIALELRKRTEQVIDELAAGGGRVDPLAQW